MKENEKKGGQAVSVRRGDSVYVRGQDGPCWGRVVCWGKDGVTLDAEDDKSRRMTARWSDYLGHRERMGWAGKVVEYGDDGAVVEDDEGGRHFIGGLQEDEESEQEPGPWERIMKSLGDGVLVLFKAQRSEARSTVPDMFSDLLDQQVEHKGYVRADGTYVKPHRQRHKVRSGDAKGEASEQAKAAERAENKRLADAEKRDRKYDAQKGVEPVAGDAYLERARNTLFVPLSGFGIAKFHAEDDSQFVTVNRFGAAGGPRDETLSQEGKRTAYRSVSQARLDLRPQQIEALERLAAHGGEVSRNELDGQDLAALTAMARMYLQSRDPSYSQRMNAAALSGDQKAYSDLRSGDHIVVFDHSPEQPPVFRLTRHGRDLVSAAEDFGREMLLEREKHVRAKQDGDVEIPERIRENLYRLGVPFRVYAEGLELARRLGPRYGGEYADLRVGDIKAAWETVEKTLASIPDEGKRNAARKYVGGVIPDIEPTPDEREWMRKEFPRSIFDVGTQQAPAPALTDAERGKLEELRQMLEDTLANNPGHQNAEAWKIKLAEVNAKLGPKAQPAESAKANPVEPDKTGWSPAMRRAYGLKVEYRKNPPLNAKERGRWKSRMRAAAKATPEGDEKAVLVLDNLWSQVNGDWTPHEKPLEFAKAGVDRVSGKMRVSDAQASLIEVEMLDALDDDDEPWRHLVAKYFDGDARCLNLPSDREELLLMAGGFTSLGNAIDAQLEAKGNGLDNEQKKFLRKDMRAAYAMADKLYARLKKGSAKPVAKDIERLLNNPDTEPEELRGAVKKLVNRMSRALSEGDVEKHDALEALKRRVISEIEPAVERKRERSRTPSFEVGDSVRLGTFSGFISDVFPVRGEPWARVTNWAETNSTTGPLSALTIIKSLVLLKAQRRAKKGGERGVNGEWYEGGKWIANTERAKKRGSVRPTGRQEVAPYQWESPPPGMRSIYSRWSGVWERLADGKMRCRQGLPVERWGEDFLAEAQEMADRWNAGERWIEDTRPVAKAMVLIKATGTQVANRPGLALQQTSDKLGHTVKRWKRTSPEEKAGRHGHRVSFQSETGHDISGHVVASGERGVTVRDERGGHHRVEHGDYLKHKGDEQPGGKADAKPRGGRIDHGAYQSPIPPETIEKAPHDARQRTENNINALFQQAKKALPQYQAWADKVAGALNAQVVDINKGGKPDIGQKGIQFIIGPIKGKDRVQEKAEGEEGGDYTAIRDVVRGTVAVDSLDQLGAVWKALEAHEVKFARKPRDRFANPAPAEYRDIITSVTMPNGHICELQINVKPMLVAKDKAHKLYEAHRSLAADVLERGKGLKGATPAESAKMEMLERKQTAIYRKAWADITHGRITSKALGSWVILFPVDD